jgi:hypothetical protein
MGGTIDAARSEVAAEWSVLRYRPVDWFLLSGSRLAVSAGLLALVAAVFWWVVLSGLAPLTQRTPILYLLFALISGNVTLITIVVSISQFVLARHLETPGEVREQMREVVGYRQAVSEVTGERVVPVTPAGFFLVLFRSVLRDLDRIRARKWDDSEEELRRDVEDLVADLERHADHVIGLVEGSNGGVRLALFATLEANYSRYFYGIYRLRSTYEGALPEPVADDLDRLERHVEQVDVARRYFKTVLIQSELASLSRLLLFTGLPVLVATVVLMLLFTATSGPALSRPVLAVVIPLVVTAGFVPIVLLTAYILRLATVVHRTAAMYPFTTRYD